MPARSTARPFLVAHRGAPRERPENTLPSFLRALELGAEGIELDVHGTCDGVVIVHHDPVPRAIAPSGRLANRRIDALTFDEVQGLSVGGIALIPTLAEALAVVRGRADVFIEIKASGIERAVVDAIQRSSAPARCAIHSFDEHVVQRVAELAPEIRRGILFERRPQDVTALMQRAMALDVWPSWEEVDPALVEEVHAAGGRVIPWTVNDPSLARDFAAMGVDGLCTDIVPEVRAALGASA